MNRNFIAMMIFIFFYQSVNVFEQLPTVFLLNLYIHSLITNE